MVAIASRSATRVRRIRNRVRVVVAGGEMLGESGDVAETVELDMVWNRGALLTTTMAATSWRIAAQHDVSSSEHTSLQADIVDRQLP